ncbi:MAG: carbohydrate ABC transporter substrate-binding protein [Clostridia bacterium]|nr:carbohydrate ABC transporter substrate-binding protein [Clostridia bacterium]
MKKFLCLILAVLIVFPFAACKFTTGETDVEFKPTLDTTTSCEINVIGDYGNFEALEAEFDRFNKFYPNVRLSYAKTDNYQKTLRTVLEGNDKPNIFFSYTWMIGNPDYNQVLTHMEDLSDPALKLDLDCIRPSLVNHDAEGRVLMVPVFSRTYGMLVNENLFKKEGLSVPKTLTELMSVCEAFRNKGYSSPMMGYSRTSSSCFMYTVAYPLFLSALAENPDALALANDLDSEAGEYMRPALNAVKQLIDNDCVDLEECANIGNNYDGVILRFFEGDVPMMICAGDTVSGTKKRESQSEAFTKAPFDYTFAPIPMTEDGGYFIDSPSIEFSVNKDCDNLDMTNEFMRFLISKKELNKIASVKRLVTPTTDMPFDSVYAPFGRIPSERTISPEVLGIKDKLTVQIRIASYKVGKGEITIDGAIGKYGQFSE